NNVDPRTLSQAQKALGYSGADVVATLTVNLQGVIQSALATAVGSPSSSTLPQLSTEAAHALADRLAGGAIANKQQDDVLYQILHSGLLLSTKTFNTLTIGGPALRVVIVGP